MDINLFFKTISHYIVDIVPVLALGFLISGLIHEFLPDDFVNKYLSKRTFLSVLWAALVGTILPVCCIGSLPVAISFYKKGARLGPILAFLVATPATSITALLLTYRLLGLKFTIFIFFAAIIIGVIMGLIGNLFPVPPQKREESQVCEHCGAEGHSHKIHPLLERIRSVFVFAFWEMPRDIGREILIGLLLAAFISSVAPIERVIALYLGGGYGYVFALPFGLLMYMCSTGTVPLVHAFVNSGMNIGAGMVLLLAGPITSFGTLLVVKKQFGNRIVWTYLIVISALSLLLGYGFSLI
ncbi:MAG: permease [Candidatus Margulisiibacteriota bacterium]|nr:permease [Candidatus Margulisiibacteriota bacterium]